MHRILLLIIMVCASQLMNAQQTIIAGKVPSNPEEEVTLYRIQDHVSERKTVVKTVYADAKGNFQFQIFPEEVEEVIIRVKERNSRLFIEPDKVYEITIPPFPENEPKRFYTPLNWVEPMFESLEPNDVNALVSDFNFRYESFFKEHYPEIAKAENKGHNAFKKKQRSVLEKSQMITKEDSLSNLSSDDSYFNLVTGFAKASDSIYANVDNPFFEIYRRYAIGEMKLSAGLQPDAAYEMYLKDQPVEADHPEYLNFFRSFHGDVFQRLANSKKGLPLKSAINNSDGYEAVVKALVDIYPYSGSAEGIDLLVITQVQRTFAEGIFLKNALLKLLDEVEENATTELIQTMAGNVQMELAKPMAGHEVESFVLVNEKNEQVTLDDFKGKFVYINFYATWCSSCLKEMTMMENLKREYGRQIEFVSISMDEDYSDFRKFLSENRKYDWQFLYGAGDKLLKEKMGIYSLPHFLMIDPEGKRMFTHTQMPSEGIEKVFHKIKFESTKQEKIKVWDD